MNKLTNDMPRIMVAGTGSSSGKTTVSCGIMQALKRRGVTLAAFKCGPDYIDPMFHASVLGVQSRNLDVVLSGEEGVRFLLGRIASNMEFSVIEGVMGLYDGRSTDSDQASTNHIARVTKTPTVLVVDVKGMGLSLVALIHGFITFGANSIEGVVLNRCSQKMYTYYRDMIEKHLSISVFGYMPEISEVHVESRHLGLVTAAEIMDLQHIMERLGVEAERNIDIEALIKLGRKAEPFSWKNLWEGVGSKEEGTVKIAIAKDQAFAFIYQDNLDLLEKLGADIVYFSPLEETSLPDGISGLILPGGYPELHARQLSQNKEMLISIKNAVERGLPVIAECGGFMYLLEKLIDGQGEVHPMVGALPGSSWMTQQLVRFGYVKLTSEEGNLLFSPGEEAYAHEFHYSDSDNNGSNLRASKNNITWQCTHGNEQLFVGYPHLHFASKAGSLKKMLDTCRHYESRRTR